MKLRRKKHSHISKTLKFKSIAAWLSNEQSGLLSRLPLKANMRLNQEWVFFCFKLLFQHVPVVPFQNNPKMKRWYLVTIDRVDRDTRNLINEMKGQLMAKEVEIDPPFGGSSDFTTQN